MIRNKWLKSIYIILWYFETVEQFCNFTSDKIKLVNPFTQLCSPVDGV